MSSNFHNRDLQYIVSYLPVNGSLCGQLQPLTYLIPEYSKIKPWMRPNRSLTLQRQLGNDKLQVCKQLSVIILTLGGANQDNCMGVIQGKCKLFSLWSTPASFLDFSKILHACKTTYMDYMDPDAGCSKNGIKLNHSPACL